MVVRDLGSGVRAEGYSIQRFGALLFVHCVTASSLPKARRCKLALLPDSPKLQQNSKGLEPSINIIGMLMSPRFEVKYRASG